MDTDPKPKDPGWMDFLHDYPGLTEIVWRVLAVFDGLVEQVQPSVCRGCPFLTALAELPNPELPGHQHAVDVKTWVRDRFEDMTTASGATDPAAFADQLALVLEGVYASVQALGVDGPTRRARALVTQLLAPA